jgi:acetoin utilization deacetylase AcuC-like enzyme
LLEILERELPRLLDGGRPDLLLFQAGADPYCEDPYSPLDLDHAALLERDLAVFRFAKAQGLPIAWVLAGGYTRDVSQVVRVHTNTFEAALEVYG